MKYLVTEKRKHRKRNEEHYRTINKQVEQEVIKAKGKCLAKKCDDIEYLEEQHDSFDLHRKIKETTGMYKKINIGNITNKNKKILSDQPEKVIR